MNLDRGVAYAGFWRRLAAVAIDALLLTPLLLAALYLLTGSLDSLLQEQPFPEVGPLGSVAAELTLMALVVGCWVWLGGTPGKLVMNCELVRAADGSRIGVAQGILRYFCYAASALPLLAGFLWIGLDRRKQGLHDKVAGTVVLISDESRKSVEQLARELD